MNYGERYGDLTGIVERLFFVGFSAVAFLALVLVVGLLVRFLWVGTKAAEIYVRRNSPPATTPTPGASPRRVPGAPPAQPGAQGADPGRIPPSAASPVDRSPGPR